MTEEKLQRGDRIRVKKGTYFDVGATGTVQYVEPSSTIVWVLRDGASSDVLFSVNELELIERPQPGSEDELEDLSIIPEPMSGYQAAQNLRLLSQTLLSRVKEMQKEAPGCGDPNCEFCTVPTMAIFRSDMIALLEADKPIALAMMALIATGIVYGEAIANTWALTGSASNAIN